MTPQEAKELLLIHGGCHQDPNHRRMDAGFLGSLRPYRGLDVNSLHEVMTALRVLAPSLQQQQVDREVVSALWHMCELGRCWGVAPDGMLQRNNLISPPDVQRLEKWIDCISYATMILLGSRPGTAAIHEAFHRYERLA